jgi:hypothetical protein
MTNGARLALARELAFAMCAGRKAREAGQPLGGNPHLYLFHTADADAGDAAAYRLRRLHEAWGDGWRIADRYMRHRGK